MVSSISKFQIIRFLFRSLLSNHYLSVHPSTYLCIPLPIRAPLFTLTGKLKGKHGIKLKFFADLNDYGKMARSAAQYGLVSLFILLRYFTPLKVET